MDSEAGVTRPRGAVDRALTHHPHLVLGLAGVTFADPSFRNVLIIARRIAEKQAASVCPPTPSDAMTRLLELADAAVLFPAVAAGQLKHP